MSAPTVPATVPSPGTAPLPDTVLPDQAELAQLRRLLPVPPAVREQALARAAELIDSLSPQELEDLAAGRGRLVYQAGETGARPERHTPDPRAHRAARRSARRALNIDIGAVVERINACTSAAEVAAYLDGLDSRFTVPVLREIARALGPTVNATGRTKAQLHRDIVEGTIGFRERTAAMSGGAWS
ncbi:hypothetical protein SAMN05443637_1325 [Pseudonocardia thermophila]|jgi:hypothetical protein|uniref:Uncharacterized protein n=1 Tax=Pseudonocardia thermophila TaxID=1848 RepID=A0A1M7B2V2_PSETH|nr:hypothetical protein [Pseudonocardia thermophila]SHL49310.1 hypothetical protein SAMN05443637_1325 [Pseudonocardia thermophila]